MNRRLTERGKWLKSERDMWATFEELRLAFRAADAVAAEANERAERTMHESAIDEAVEAAHRKALAEEALRQVWLRWGATVGIVELPKDGDEVAA